MKLFDTDKLIKTLTGFLETKVELLKLDAQEEITKLIARLVVYMMLALTCTMALFFLTLALAILLGEWFENVVLGYASVAILYIVSGVVVYQWRKAIIKIVVAKQAQEIEEEYHEMSEEEEI